MTIISTISSQVFNISPRKSSFTSQRFLPISTIAMKFTEEEEPITPLGQDWQEDEYYQTANAFFSSSTLAALASANTRGLVCKSAPPTRTTSPEPLNNPASAPSSKASCSSSSSSSLSLSSSSSLAPSSSSASERLRLVETLMHTVAMAWDRYMALHQQSSSSFSNGDRSSPLPSFGLVVSDSDRSIVHVSAEFEMLTGYTRSDALGRSAAFLQGKLTSDSAVTVLRSALKEKRPCQVLLINYKKDGQPFWNLLTIAPSFSVDGTVDRWFGIQMVANESWRIDRPLPLFPWTRYPLPSIHPKKTKRALTPAPKAESSLVTKASSAVVVEEIDEKVCTSPRAVALSFIAETTLPTRHGRYRVRAYRQLDDSGNPTDVEIMVIVHGRPELVKEDVPVRIHDACFTSEVFHSLKCDCREQLEYAMKYIRDAKDGVVIYLPQEGRGIGLSNKIKAYAMQELGLDTVDANRALGFPDDNRAYNAVPSILQDLQIRSVRLLSNNTRKFDVLRSLGVQINGRIPVLVLPTFVDENGHADGIRLTAQVAEGAPEYVKKDTKYAENYVKAKIARMNHMQYAQDI